MSPFETTGTLTKLGFAASFLTNFFLNYITIFHIKHISGTYKHMVLYFSTIGILFSGLEVVARPFAHNYNNALFFFSTSTLSISSSILQLLFTSWAGSYLVIVSFIAVQFVYRYLFLSGNKKADCFDGFGAIIWLLYPIILGAVYTFLICMSSQPDDYTDSYIKAEVLKNYGVPPTSFPRIVIVPYEPDGSLRVKNWIVLAYSVFMISLHYSVILYCGLKMHLNVKDQLEKFSIPQRNLQRQMFKALVVQSVGPTIFLVIPAVPVLLSPLIPPSFRMKISWQTGWLFPLIGLYPPFDSIAFMLIVSEFRKVIKNILCACFGVTIYGIAIHFVYRKGKLKYFKKKYLVLWFLIPIVGGVSWFVVARYFFTPTQTTWSISDQQSKNFTTWKSRIPCKLVVFTTQLSWKIVSTLLEYGESEFSKNVQMQLYKALVAQTTVPIILLFIPFGILFTLLIFKLGCQFLNRIIVLIFAFYPAIDPLPIIYFVGVFKCKMNQIHETVRISIDN